MIAPIRGTASSCICKRPVAWLSGASAASPTLKTHLTGLSRASAVFEEARHAADLCKQYGAERVR